MPALIQSAGQLTALDDRGPWGHSGTLGGAPSLRLYADRAQAYGTIIRHQPNVRTVISFLARNLAQLGVQVFERVTDTDRQRVTDHPFAEALRRPNPADRRLTTYRLMHRTVWDCAAFDVAIWALLEAPGLGRPVIVPLRPDRVTIKGHLWPTEYVYHGARGVRSFDPDHVVYFQASHNIDDPLWGLPPIEALRRIIAEDEAAGEYREQYWRSGARFSGWIKRPTSAPDWKPEAKTRFNADWNNQWTGQGGNAGGTPILEDDMEFHQAEGADARSAQYVEARKLSREEAAALWHIDPIWVGIAAAGMSFSSVVERHKALYQDTLGPWVVMLEQDLTFQALPAFEPEPARRERLYTKLNIAEKLRGSVEDLAESVSKLTGRPILTANEGRALIERNDLPEGDGLALPLAVRITGDGTSPGLTVKEMAEIIQKLYLGVGVVITVEEARAILRDAGVDLPADFDFDDPDDDPPADPILPASRQLATPAALFEAQHQEAHREVLTRTLSRQGAEVLSEYGDGTRSLDLLWDKGRWDAELQTDLFGLALDLAVGYGAEASAALGLDGLDEDAWVPALDEDARRAAEAINAETTAQLATALDAEDVPAAFGRIFFAAARVEEIARVRYVEVVGFTARAVTAEAARRVDL